MGKIIKLDNLLKRGKPSITIARLIARTPKWENQVKFQHGFWDLAQREYTVYPEDLDSLQWWGHTVASSRNTAVEIMLQRGSDYLLFFDDDMTVVDFAESVDKMVELDKDVVGAIGVTKGAPHWPNIVKVLKFGETKTVCDAYTHKIYEWPEDKAFEVDWIGAAFMLIKRKVFEKLPRPWFYMPPCYISGNIIGEDNTFCYNAKMYGFEVWADPTIEMGHIGEFAYSVKRISPCFFNYKQGLIDDAQKHMDDFVGKGITNADHTHNLVPEVQAEMKKGLGTPKMFI